MSSPIPCYNPSPDTEKNYTDHNSSLSRNANANKYSNPYHNPDQSKHQSVGTELNHFTRSKLDLDRLKPNTDIKPNPYLNPTQIISSLLVVSQSRRPTMANRQLMREQVVASCFWRAHLFSFSSRAFSCSQAMKPCRLLSPCIALLSEKFILGGLYSYVGKGTKSKYAVAGRRSLCMRATTHVNNDPGSINSPLMESMERKIKEHLSAESVTVKDAYGDGRHVSIDVISSAFEGQSVVNRQRMVYKAIWEELQNAVHAVDQMITRTPTEAANEE